MAGSGSRRRPRSRSGWSPTHHLVFRSIGVLCLTGGIAALISSDALFDRSPAPSQTGAATEHVVQTTSVTPEPVEFTGSLPTGEFVAVEREVSTGTWAAEEPEPPAEIVAAAERRGAAARAAAEPDPPTGALAAADPERPVQTLSGTEPEAPAEAAASQPEGPTGTLAAAETEAPTEATPASSEAEAAEVADAPSALSDEDDACRSEGIGAGSDLSADDCVPSAAAIEASEAGSADLAALPMPDVYTPPADLSADPQAATFLARLPKPRPANAPTRGRYQAARGEALPPPPDCGSLHAYWRYIDRKQGLREWYCR